jgi:hypothetical protein
LNALEKIFFVLDIASPSADGRSNRTNFVQNQQIASSFVIQPIPHNEMNDFFRADSISNLKINLKNL